MFKTTLQSSFPKTSPQFHFECLQSPVRPHILFPRFSQLLASLPENASNWEQMTLSTGWAESSGEQPHLVKTAAC
jgi:hypothetical protein